jgi:hypothetical protein
MNDVLYSVLRNTGERNVEHVKSRGTANLPNLFAPTVCENKTQANMDGRGDTHWALAKTVLGDDVAALVLLVTRLTPISFDITLVPALHTNLLGLRLLSFSPTLVFQPLTTAATVFSPFPSPISIHVLFQTTS